MTRTFGKRAQIVLMAAGLTTSLLGQTSASSSSLPQAANGLTVPMGFGAGVFAATPGVLPTSLTFGPDGRLYVATVSQGTDGTFLGTGRILAFQDLGGVGGPPQIVAEGFKQLLGITFGPDGTLYATDNDTRNFTGQVLALRDTNADGTYDQRRTVLRNIPNGRHQTNGMAFGPDGALYLANGNATDDGIECGPPDGEPCPAGSEEKKPWTGAIIRVNPAWQNVDLQNGVRVDSDGQFAADGLDDESVLVSPGYRNIYDVDFWPGDPSMIYTPMNGSDQPATNEPLYRTDINDTKVVGQDGSGNPIWGPVIDDAGFPSCVYGSHPNNFPFPDPNEIDITGLGHGHPETFEPEDSQNPATIDRFGRCRKNEVIRPLMFFREAHNGTSGLAFERGEEFPHRYDSDLFVAEWGSLWNLNGATPSGHKITHVDIDPDTGLPLRKREFMTGVLPMDLTFGPDGAMYVADMQGLIYRVVHVLETSDTATVEMVAGQLVPSLIAIPRDTSVLWVNLDTTAHNIRTQARVLIASACVPPNAGSCSEMDSPGDIPPRGSYRYDFGRTEGVWKYTSTTNPTDAAMQGTIVVGPTDR